MTMTVGELRQILNNSNLSDETPVILHNGLLETTCEVGVTKAVLDFESAPKDRHGRISHYLSENGSVLVIGDPCTKFPEKHPVEEFKPIVLYLDQGEAGSVIPICLNAVEYKETFYALGEAHDFSEGKVLIIHRSDCEILSEDTTENTCMIRQHTQVTPSSLSTLPTEMQHILQMFNL